MKALRLLVCLAAYLTLTTQVVLAQESASSAVPTEVERPCTDLLPAAANESERPALRLYAPGMFGDLLQLEAVRQSVGNHIEATAPVAIRGPYKVADNASPRPLDRVFVTGNYFGDVNSSFLTPNAVSPSVFQALFGFEKTFLQGKASVGMRLPYYQLTGDPTLNATRIGDLSILVKYAFVNHPDTGSAFSGGLMITAPTGPSLHLAGQSSVNPVIVQPWLGELWCHNNLFVQGFESLAIPTDARDVTIFFKSIGAGYWLYRASDPTRLLSAVVPDVELHFATPLNHKGLNNLPIGFPDTLDCTAGLYLFLRHAVLGVGVGTPLVGPDPYDYLVTTNLNFRF